MTSDKPSPSRSKEEQIGELTTIIRKHAKDSICHADSRHEHAFAELGKVFQELYSRLDACESQLIFDLDSELYDNLSKNLTWARDASDSGELHSALKSALQAIECWRPLAEIVRGRPPVAVID